MISYGRSTMIDEVSSNTVLQEFRVQDTESAGFLNLKLTANGWKLVGFEIPESELREFLKKKGRNPFAPASPPR